MPKQKPPKIIRRYPTDNVPFITLMATLASGVIAFLAATVFFLFQAPQGPDAPLESSLEQPTITPTSACGSSSDVQTCCSEWANTNNIMTTRCVGEWQIQKDGSCGWVCGIEN